MEELLGSLFVLYMLGSIVAGFFRRGAGTGDNGQGPDAKPARPGFPEVLDMDELERRLREIRSGKREPDAGRAPSAAPESPAAPAPKPIPIPSPEARPPAPAPTVPRPATARPAPAFRPTADALRPTDGVGWDDDADDWGDLTDSGWAPVSGPAEQRRPSRPGQLPAAVATFLERGNPWQAAFVVKELLGPPRALQPHRRRPPF